MAIPTLIIGESGTGKSASIRNFTEKEIAAINVAGKPLPFKNKIISVTTDDYDEIKKYLNQFSKKYKSIVIDDAQYLMANEFMRRATERGYDKFTEIAQNFWELINNIKTLPDDVIVYILSHIERDQNGNEKIKTIGKLLDEKITVEGMFTIVLKTNVTDGKYSFLTQNSGHDTVKSPIGMFPSYVIDNDLKYVDEKIRNYYELGEFLSDEKMEELDETVKREDVVIEEDKKPKRGRRKKTEESVEEVTTPEVEKEVAPEPKKRGRKKKNVSEELEKEREEVQKENAEIIANSNLPDTEEGVPFEEAEMPKLNDLPKRKSRNKVAEVDTGTGAIVGDDQVVNETSEEVEDKPTVRRRRRRTN